MSPAVPEIAGFEELVLLGQGGFASVYSGRQPSAGRDVAIKVLNARLDDETLVRFERECQALGTVAAHPGICTLYSSGQTPDGHPYLVMELCERTIGDRVRADGPMSERDVVAALTVLAEALRHAHQRGILHRDVKPDNVLITQFGRPVLTDFGIARIEDGFYTSSGVVTASVAHAAPEVLDGEAPTVRSDVWSLASTGYQLLTGAAPFRRTGEAPSATIARVLREPPPDLRKAGVSDAVASVLEEALAKDPEARTPDMASFAAGLRASTLSQRRAAGVSVAGGLAAAGRLRAAPLVVEPVVPAPRAGTSRLALWLVGAGFAALAVIGALAAGGVIAGDGGSQDGASSTSSSTTISTVAPVDARAQFCVTGADAEGLSIRRTAGIRTSAGGLKPASDVLNTIPNGTCGVRDLTIDEEIQTVSGAKWRRIDWNGIDGWVAASYLTSA